ncbi:MAG: prolyl oligopeptidase family serine peptidase [Candidatus Nanopelagicales bacterium]
MTYSFPRQQARTRRFRLGAPGNFQIGRDGSRVAFTRSSSGTDPVNCLWLIERDGQGTTESLVADPTTLNADDEQLPDVERARRERMRETAAGITSFATDRDVTVASFALSGQVGIAGLSGERDVQLLNVAGPAIDPRVDPTGQRVAWVSDGSLHVAEIDGSHARVLVRANSANETWGLADFLAAEEFDRMRGFWWSPDGTQLLVQQTDDANVDQWWIADPASPASNPRQIRYPAAGTENPDIALWLVNLDGERVEVKWDHDRYCYLLSVQWDSCGPALVTVLNREQNDAVVWSVAQGSVVATEVARLTDPCWVEFVPGTPAWSPNGQLVNTACGLGSVTGVSDAITLDGSLLGPEDMRVRAVLDVADDGLLLATNSDPAECDVTHLSWDGKATAVQAGGWNGALRGGATLLLAHTDFGELTTTYRMVELPTAASVAAVASIASHAEVPAVDLHLDYVRVGERDLAAVVLWPHDHAMGSRRLPVIMNPYGGPHAQRVLASGRSFAENQWLADQGFAVIVADGRGSPGRGAAWEREIFLDLATTPLADQVDALAAVAARWPEDIDTERVGITGWSFGGYLAALAVLRRPDVFRAAVAGAPVTNWHLYDTAYTERYLGNPQTDEGPYEASSLLPLAPGLVRPLMIIHGMADDNVVVAHSLQLSGALTAAGRRHEFLPLSNVTHMTQQEEVAENLLLLELDFFRHHLG